MPRATLKDIAELMGLDHDCYFSCERNDYHFFNENKIEEVDTRAHPRQLLDFINREITVYKTYPVLRKDEREFLTAIRAMGYIIVVNQVFSGNVAFKTNKLKRAENYSQDQYDTDWYVVGDRFNTESLSIPGNMLKFVQHHIPWDIDKLLENTDNA